MELTYDNMLAHLKKWLDMLPSVTPENKDKLKELFVPESMTPYEGGVGEWDHVSAHWETYRAHVTYEPLPFYITIDDRRKMAAIYCREEAKQPVTGELVKVFKDPYTGEMVATIYLMLHVEFTLVDGEVKVKSQRFGRVDPARWYKVLPEG